ncbi:MAG TPA: GatB/YqeY domain-containing protein [Polyangiaceae bacterium]|nr:GatB/YqeY domain-containing protein [Polyangiaceae bacterium]
MALLDQIKARMFAAMKSGNVTEREILKVAMGEITTDAARPGKKGDDEETLGILRKLVKSNEESIEASQDEAQKAQLRAEIEVLATFLPKSLGVPEIVAALVPVAEAVKAAGNDGQATGVAMKHLKTLGANVNGKDVSAAVRQLRGA